ncbi:hypothetical protein [Longimicrobium terrae]|uniref:Uncharacterized protein n=1 Tax=Longimicrobium terrae TaxID=1639882 RepID=A0A841H6C5_9BACT|nr:hypothetical protein [Longimicrobium terrae]MBB4639244.1 hypothetical protein [Longimicrobium terrae]MBB6073484.1 hypothetical protein [Longimicrobium terrae]NNC32266.1 hypothetical protein [Longimicrobium terrae]
MIFNCPVCHTPAGELAASGTQTLFCGNCRFKYHITAGRLESRGSREIVHSAQTHQSAARTSREYEFRIAQPEGLRTITLRIPGREDRFIAHKNDKLAIVHAMRGDVAENAIAVINQTTGKEVVIGKPGQTTLFGSVVSGMAAGLITLFALAALDVSGTIAALLSVLLAGIVAYTLQEKLKPRHAISAAQQSALGRSTQLLLQKSGLEQRIQEVTADRRQRMEIREKLLGLQAKMQEVGADLYQTRMDRIRGALPLLDEQLALDDKLLHAYRRTQLMMEIELESSSAADAIPESLPGEFGARQAEIEAIEARTSDLKLLLSANEEVERFIRGE